jgi:hypothetical protein
MPKALPENQWWVVEVNGQPQPAAGLYKSRSGVNKKKREFQTASLNSQITVGVWQNMGGLTWQKIS